MTKLFMALTLTLAVSGVFGQDLTSKKGEPILPEKADWSIGIDATPFLNYAGNFFGTLNKAPTFNFLTNNNTIVGKYFFNGQTALRAGLRIGFNSATQRYNTDDRVAQLTPGTYPAAAALKENKWKTSSSAIGISAGIEKRKGKTMLQGIYGAELGMYFSSSKDKFTYGNNLIAAGNGVTAITVDSTGDAIPGAFNIDKNPPVQGAIDANGARITERKNASQFTFGVRGFVGVEYFIFPKISLGGEFGWGLGFTTYGKSSTTYESSGSTALGSTIATTKITGPKSGSFQLDTDNKNSVWGPSGALRLNFYF